MNSLQTIAINSLKAAVCYQVTI